MSPETQQRILRVLYSFLEDVGSALGFESYSYDEAIRDFREGVRTHGSMVSTLSLSWAKNIVPGGADSSVEPERIDEYLAQMDTKEKAEAVLLSLPEPDPEWLELTLNMVRDELPRLRQAFLPFVKRLPHFHLGGRPEELPDPNVRRKIRGEIKQLRGPGIKLEEIYARLAARYGVSASTIKRIRFEEPDEISEGVDSMKPTSDDRERDLIALVDRKAEAIWDGTHDLNKLGPEMRLGDLHLSPEDINVISARVQWWKEGRSPYTKGRS